MGLAALSGTVTKSLEADRDWSTDLVIEKLWRAGVQLPVAVLNQAWSQRKALSSTLGKYYGYPIAC